MNDHKTEGFFDTNDDSINWVLVIVVNLFIPIVIMH